jgi:hypothetical protein
MWLIQMLKALVLSQHSRTPTPIHPAVDGLTRTDRDAAGTGAV